MLNSVLLKICSKIKKKFRKDLFYSIQIIFFQIKMNFRGFIPIEFDCEYLTRGKIKKFAYGKRINQRNNHPSPCPLKKVFFVFYPKVIDNVKMSQTKSYI